MKWNRCRTKKKFYAVIEDMSAERAAKHLECWRQVTCLCRFLPVEVRPGLLKDGQIKRARFTEEQIIGVLREHEAGAKTAIGAKHGVAEGTLYSWKAKFGGMDVSEAGRLQASRARERQAEEAAGRADVECCGGVI